MTTVRKRASHRVDDIGGRHVRDMQRLSPLGITPAPGCARGPATFLDVDDAAGHRPHHIDQAGNGLTVQWTARRPP
ncbi:hypothetical protein AB0M46_23495 [Dactylosporangium sp. NPDC051485]|uniref:hypothetical protein n=1 Tax=Dactylosporangium sp. NPDC051485 TaxID=3154846 RepID=UPI003436F916